MKKSVYIETSVVSYLTARTSRDMLAGYSCPEICTPEELMGDHADAG
jgi:hypothetical protein